MMKKGFSLIELLVVIAIIALLLTIMIPSIARAKEQGREIYCQNNLRQMHLTAMVYVYEQDGFYPIAYYSAKTAEERVQYSWDFTLRRPTGGDIQVEPGILWRGQTIDKIQQCPSFKGESNTNYDPYTGYNYNTSYIGHGQQETIAQPSRGLMIGYPSACALFGDGQTTNGANKYMRSPLASESDWNFSGRWGGTQGFRHHLSTNVVWCDGSVDGRIDCYTGSDRDGSREIVETYNRDNPKSPIGFLSEGNTLYDLR